MGAAGSGLWAHSHPGRFGVCMWRIDGTGRGTLNQKQSDELAVYYRNGAAGKRGSLDEGSGNSGGARGRGLDSKTLLQGWIRST